MSLTFFEEVLRQLRPYTQELTFHVLGDPLTLSNLSAYLALSHRYGFRIMLTTSGYYLEKHLPETLLHPCVKQLNISLNSFNKNDLSLTKERYFKAIETLCTYKLKNRSQTFINLRLWNLDEVGSDMTFNETVFDFCEKLFQTPIDRAMILNEHPKSYRVASKILLHFDEYFQWPSLKNEKRSDGRCHGLQSHFGILADGRVVPCCLDGEGVITLGNIHEESLTAILGKKRTLQIIEGFKKGHAVEELCQKCTYKHRFDVD